MSYFFSNSFVTFVTQVKGINEQYYERNYMFSLW